MEPYRIEFDGIAWQTPAVGARFKVHREGARQFRLLELTPEFEEPEWCEKGHAGFIVAGELDINFHGLVVRFPQGSALSVPAGPQHGHKAKAVTPLVRLFLIEDVGSAGEPNA
jgi:quercetin dioxygenase-like cupin family protein